MKYEVKYRMWDLGDIILKKGDVIWITKTIDYNVVEIDCDYFASHKRVDVGDLEMHCREI
jgi:hypothetical protein